MLDIKLTKIEFDNKEEESAASFELRAAYGAMEAIRAESRSRLSAIVSFPCGAGGALQTDVGRQAHELLLEHLEAFAEELREILKD